MDQANQKYVFVLGREQEICLAELRSVLDRFCFSFSASASRRRDGDIYKISGNLVFAKMSKFEKADANKLINLLAGTVKIYEIVDSFDRDVVTKLVRIISAYKSGASSKFNFGISCFNRNFTKQQVNSFGINAKKNLKSKFSIRYVEARDSLELSSIVSLKNDLIERGIEIGIFDDCLGVLVALNNPEEWSKRDYGKPRADKFSGMLPPKLARMMVNLALGQISESVDCRPKTGPTKDHRPRTTNNVQRTTVVDPFCGSGNILLEAMLVGCDVIGSDISEKAVNDSILNSKWLADQIRSSSKKCGRVVEILQADATQAEAIKNYASKAKNYDCIAVVSEPYLGEPKKFKPSHNAVRGEYAKVRKIYLDFLNNMGILKDFKPVLCIVFPRIETTEGKIYSLFEESVDEIKKLGYTQVRTPFIYGRDYQVVKREIVLLQMKQV